MILIAEDNFAMANIYRRIFEASGIDCEIVDQGDTVIQKLDTQQYCLLVLDCEMPGTNGLELIEYARTAGKNVTTPIVLCTANPCIEDTGFADTQVLHKPIATQKMLDRALESAFGTLDK